VVKNTILHFSRRYAMDIDHLGEALVEQLVELGLVSDVADLYDLEPAQLAELERMGNKSACNVVEAICESKTRTLDRLLTGLGIDHVGQVAARQLAESAGSLDTLLGWGPTQAAEQVSAIAGFGPKMVESVCRFLADPSERALLEKLMARSVSSPMPKAEIADGPLRGASFCVTGVLSRKREDVHADIRARGGEVHDKVKKGTTILVAGEKVGKSKLDSAKKHGVTVIGEVELERMLRGEMALPELLQN
jgi:DNA ligase (NAD+)